MLKLVLKNISSWEKFLLLVISIAELQMNAILYLLIVGLRIDDINLLTINKDILPRKNRDLLADAYGRKLLSLCKTPGLIIANGRLSNGDFIFMSMARVRLPIYYLAVQVSIYKRIYNLRT